MFCGKKGAGRRAFPLLNRGWPLHILLLLLIKDIHCTALMHNNTLGPCWIMGQVLRLGLMTCKDDEILLCDTVVLMTVHTAGLRL